MTERARVELARGRQIVIFPEGTRRAPGAEPSYKYGIVHLYGETGIACLPIALNSGLFWPRRSFLRYPGTIVAEILDPIPPGLEQGRVRGAPAAGHRDRDRAAHRRRRARACEATGSRARRSRARQDDAAAAPCVSCTPLSRSASRCSSVSR